MTAQVETATRSARKLPPRVHCPAEGCTYTMDSAGSIPAHLAMAHPEVPMDAIAPKREAICRGGHPAWQGFICTTCGKDIRTGKRPTTSAAAPEPTPDGSARREPAAIADPGAAPAAGGPPTSLAIAEIVVEDNVREDLGDLEQLVESIREHGLLQAVLVDRVDDAWRLVDGHRRLEASRRAGLVVVPVQVASRRFDGAQRKTVQVVANALRKDLSPIEEAKAYQHILSGEKGLTQAELARRLSIAPSTLANALRILEAAPKVQDMVEAGSVSAAHVKAVLGLPEADQVRLVTDAASRGQSAHSLEESAKWYRQQASEKAKKAKASVAAAASAVAALAGIPAGSPVTLAWEYSVDGDTVRDAIAAAGFENAAGWGPTADGCGCTTVRLNVSATKAEVELICIDKAHQEAREAARQAKRQASEQQAERQASEQQAELEAQLLRSGLEAALARVSPTLLRVILRQQEDYNGKTWTEYGKLSNADVVAEVSRRLARANGAKAMPVAKVVEALRAEARS